MMKFYIIISIYRKIQDCNRFYFAFLKFHIFFAFFLKQSSVSFFFNIFVHFYFFSKFIFFFFWCFFGHFSFFDYYVVWFFFLLSFSWAQKIQKIFLFFVVEKMLGIWGGHQKVSTTQFLKNLNRIQAWYFLSIF